MRYILILHSFVVQLICACVALGSTAAAARPPNVVIFLVDDQGYGDLGCHGNSRVRTPRMDGFAREAVELTQFYAMPVCAPTRASLMTGRYHMRTGVTDVYGPASEMKPEEMTLAEVMREAGYATGLFGKWHLGGKPGQRPNDQGFDESLTHSGAVLRQYFDPTLLVDGEPKAFRGYCMDIFAGRAIEFMRKHRDEPFFLYLPANLIHSPLQVAEELARRYAEAGLDAKTSKVWAMLENVDTNFGRILDVLRELDLEKNTVVLLASDNGPCTESVTTQRFMAGLRGLKGTVYEGGIRVPAFFRWPARLRGSGQAAGVGSVLDVMPTILDACGVQKPAAVHWDGTSLLPLLRNPTAAWPERTIVFQWDGHPEPQRGSCFAVRHGRYKLVQPVGLVGRQQHIAAKYTEISVAEGRGALTIGGEPCFQLFDIEGDPGETKDLAAERPELVTQLRRHYEAWFDDVWSNARRLSRTEAPASK